MLAPAKRIPVILDTDIGGDIDDTWALVMLLNSPELDIRLILTTGHNTYYKAQIVARMLEIAGRTDIPIGLGEATSDTAGFQAAWLDSFDMNRYAGDVYRDGVTKLAQCVMGSPEVVTVIAIGPLGNLAAALRMQPEIASKARVIGMHGSIRKGYFGADRPSREYNVAAQPDAGRQVFAADWEMTIAPLDTCGTIVLTGEKYQEVLHSDRPLARALIENYRVWLQARKGMKDVQPGMLFERSTLLCDTEAVYLAFSEELVQIETLGVTVSEHGDTVIDPGAKPIRCATSWLDFAAFQDILVRRITA
ncbi:MAG: nucleoside hydrolase [Clostridiaceae bacterium]|nr:nucleoside hydrolase [Clostridiaceae bacterium]